MRTILVLVGGSETDSTVFETALAAARAVDGHLEFLHVSVSLADAAVMTPHVDFAMGPGLTAALSRLAAKATARSTAAAAHFSDFCAREAIASSPAPSPAPGLSAAWREEPGNVERLIFRARRNDHPLGRLPPVITLHFPIGR